MATIPIEGTHWHTTDRRRELVEVRRVWQRPGRGWTVRTTPTSGGPKLERSATWFLNHHTPAPEQ